MSEEGAQLYLVTLCSALQEAGDTETAALLEKASYYLQKRYFHELSETLLQVFVSPVKKEEGGSNNNNNNSGTVSPFLRDQAYEINENLLVPIRADISPYTYVKLIDFVCFSHLSTDGDAATFNDNNFEKALQVLEGAVVSLVAQQEEQARQAAQCIRAILLLEEAVRSEAFQSAVTSPSSHRVRPGQSSAAATNNNNNNNNTTMHATQSSLQALAAIPGSGPHTARKLLEEVERYLKGLQAHEVEGVLLYYLHKARGKDYQLRKQFSEFYKNSFDVVLCAEKAQLQMSEEEITLLAFQSAVAALVSESTFNMGTFLQFTPFTSRLTASKDRGWVLLWLQLFDAGDVSGFESFYESHQDTIKRYPDIQLTIKDLHHKVRLMALLHMVFYTPFHKRVFTYAQISERCGVKPPPPVSAQHHTIDINLLDSNHNNNKKNEEEDNTTVSFTDEEEDGVELLLLDALAQGIVRGKLDGLEQTARLEWVQPRVLRPEEVNNLSQHFHTWRLEVDKLKKELVALQPE